MPKVTCPECNGTRKVGKSQGLFEWVVPCDRCVDGEIEVDHVSPISLATLADPSLLEEGSPWIPSPEELASFGVKIPKHIADTLVEALILVNKELVDYGICPEPSREIIRLVKQYRDYEASLDLTNNLE